MTNELIADGIYRVSGMETSLKNGAWVSDAGTYLVTNQTKLAEIPEARPGDIAFTAGYGHIWQLDVDSTTWVELPKTAAGTAATQAAASATAAAGSASAAAASASQAQTVAASIPADYTSLSNSVVDLKSAITNLPYQNEFDNNILTDGYINQQGVDTYNPSVPGWYTTDYMPVEPGKSYTYSGLTNVGISPSSAYYNSRKTVLLPVFKQATGTNTIIAPDNAAYIRFSIYTDDLNTFAFTVKKFPSNDEVNALSESINTMQTHKVAIPLDTNNRPTNGTNGQVLRTKGTGATEWAAIGLPTDEQTRTAVSNWLTEHPEATTTVQDGSLTHEKLALGTLNFVTPGMFGAIGDGITDDTTAITNLLNCNVPTIIFDKKTYFVTREIATDKNHEIIGNNATIEFSENTQVSDIRLLKFDGVDSLSVKNLNFSIKCTNTSPFPNTGEANTDGILVSCVNCYNVTIEGCKFDVIDNGVSFGCTCFWVSGTYGDNYNISNCIFNNASNGQRGGCAWFFGNHRNVTINDSVLINSTLDENACTWTPDDSTVAVDLTFNNCRFQVTGANHQILSSQKNSHLYIYNSIIEENVDNVCSCVVKANGGSAIVDGCEMVLYGRSTNKAFLSTGAGSKIVVANCNIKHTSLDNNNNSVIWLSDNGNMIFDRNRVTLTGDNLTYLIIDTNSGNSTLSMADNVVEFDGDVSNLINDYNAVVALNNSFVGNYYFNSYENYQSQAHTIVMLNNNYACSGYGTFWFPTKHIPNTNGYIVGAIAAHGTASVQIGTPKSYYDMKLVMITGIGPQRYSTYLLTPGENRSSFVACKIAATESNGTPVISCSVSGENLVLTVNSDYASSATYMLITDMY